jgi:FAD-NAD(P)-binding
VIAVIGGGASGTLTASSLLREAADRRVPLQVALIDRHGRHGLGQAYSTTHPAHLLNSPASAMSALAGDPGHLARWAAENGLPDDGFLTWSVPRRRSPSRCAPTECLRRSPNSSWNCRMPSRMTSTSRSCPMSQSRLPRGSAGQLSHSPGSNINSAGSIWRAVVA